MFVTTLTGSAHQKRIISSNYKLIYFINLINSSKNQVEGNRTVFIFEAN